MSKNGDDSPVDKTAEILNLPDVLDDIEQAKKAAKQKEDFDDLMASLDNEIKSSSSNRRPVTTRLMDTARDPQDKEKEALLSEIESLSKETKKIIAPTPVNEEFSLESFAQEQKAWAAERQLRDERMGKMQNSARVSEQKEREPAPVNTNAEKPREAFIGTHRNNTQLSEQKSNERLDEIAAVLKQGSDWAKAEKQKTSDSLNSREEYEKKITEIQVQAAVEEKQNFVSGALDKAQQLIEYKEGEDQEAKDQEAKDLIDLLKNKGEKKSESLQKAEDLSKTYVETSVKEQRLSEPDKVTALEIGNVAVDSYVADVAQDKRFKLPTKIEKLKVAVSSFVDHVKDFATKKIDKEEFVERLKNNWGAADDIVIAGKGAREAQKEQQKQQNSR